MGARIQPACPRIDWANPITRGLVFAATPTGLRTPSPIETPYGLAARTPTIIPAWDNRSAFIDMPELTIVGVSMRNGMVNGGAAQYALRFRNPGNSNAGAMGLGLDSYSDSRRVSFFISYGDYSSAGLDYTMPDLPNSERVVTAATHSVSSGQMNLWLNGNMVASAAAQNKTLFTDTTTAMFGDATGGTTNDGFPTLLAAMWSRTLSAGELESIGRNPYQIFIDDAEADDQMFASTAPVADTSLVGAAACLVSATGLLSTAVRLTGAASLQTSASGALTTQVRLSGAAALAASASSSLSTGIPLSGAVTLQVSAAGALTGVSAALAGTASLVASSTGTLTTQVRLSGSAALQVSAAGALDGGAAQLTGAAVARVSATGALSTSIPLSGAAALQVAASGLLAGAGTALGGDAVVRVSATGTLATSIALSGTAALQVSVAASLAGSAVVLSGAASMRSSGAGELSTAIVLTGLVPMRAAASGSLTTWIGLSGMSRTAASAAGVLGAGIRYARAPAGSGYTPQREERQSRPAEIQRNRR